MISWFKRLRNFYLDVLEEVHELDKVSPPYYPGHSLEKDIKDLLTPYHYDPREKELDKGDTK